MKMDTKTMYATMNPLKLFFVMALPGMVSMFAMSIYSIIEGIFVGQKLGEAAFAAINIGIPMVMVNFSLADLVGVGASVPISIALGKKDEKTANNLFTCSVILIFCMAVLMGAIMLFATDPLVRLMGADDSIAGIAAKYIRTFAVCSPFCTIFFAMDNYLRISGYVKTSMLINIFCNASTLALLALFLFGMGMDVSGSALATCLSMCMCAVMAMTPFVRGEALLKFVRPRFSVSMLKQIVACGSPVFLSNIAGRVTSVLMNISLMSLGVKVLGEGGGTTAVAVYAVLMYAGDLCQPLLYGMSDSISPALGFNWGAENYDRVKKLAKTCFIGGAVVSVASTAVLFFFSRSVACLFVDSSNTAYLDLASHALKLFSIAYLVRWFAIIAQNFLSAIEKPVHATIVSVATALVFPVILLGALWNMGLNGIWLNTFGTSLLTAILAAVLIIHVQKNIRRPMKSAR